MGYRKDYKALRVRYEGSSYLDPMKTQANAMMMRTIYHRHAIKLNLEHFISIHLEAYRMFGDIIEPLTESMKILFLRGGIRPEASYFGTLT